MYVIMIYYNECWRKCGTYQDYNMADWILTNQIINHMACIVDASTGEVLTEK